jgi:putative ABC transport system ATP-binding protein
MTGAVDPGTNSGSGSGSGSEGDEQLGAEGRLGSDGPRRSLVAGLRQAAVSAPSLRRGLGTTLVLAIIGALGALVVPVLLQRLLDDELLGPSGPDVAAAVRLGALAAVIATAAGLASWRAMFRLVRTAASGLHELRMQVFDHLHAVPTLAVARERRGALVARVTADIETVTQFIEWGGIGMLTGATQLTVVAVLMVTFDPVLAAVVLTIAVVYALSLLSAQRFLARRYDRIRTRVASSLAIVGETISGLPTIRAYGIESRAADRVSDALETQFRVESRTRLLGATLFSTSELFAALMTISVVAIGITTADTTGVTAGQLAAFLLLVTLFVAPVQLLVEIIDQAQSAAAGLRRVLDVLDTPKVDEPVEPRSPTPGPLAVAVRDLSYAYPQGPDVLRSVTVDIPAGQRVAIVGRTGSGKSTFVKVLTRLQQPPAGAIEIGGVPLEAIATRELRRRVAFVPQDPFLLDVTILENVRYGDPDADDARILAAFEDLDLSEWLATLPGGATTRAGERGSRLSAGERQLVALVRAWVLGPDLIVLDEATSAVDPELDVRLRRAVERMTSGRTSLTVAHRLSTAEVADRVLVFADGRLVEDGHHDELLRLDGTYARLHANWTVDATIS